MHFRPSTLEITVLSAEDLTLSHRRLKKNAFVTVRSDPKSEGASTSVDVDGGGYPRWNEKVRVALPPAARAITVEVHCRTGGAVRLVGKAAVPVSDFCDEMLPGDYLHFLSYRLRGLGGERNGIINLSVRAYPPQTPPPTMVGGAGQAGYRLAGQYSYGGVDGNGGYY